jgi:hypothetical protein
VTQGLERFLNAMAGVRTVRLNSNGGRILEAHRMSDLITSRNLATFVARDCLSACTIVFLGGKERFMLPTVRLGFHQPAFRGMTASDRRAAIATEQQRLHQPVRIERGVRGAPTAPRRAACGIPTRMN